MFYNGFFQNVWFGQFLSFGERAGFAVSAGEALRFSSEYSYGEQAAVHESRIC
jgi:hypothetical protein